MKVQVSREVIPELEWNKKKKKKKRERERVREREFGCTGKGMKNRLTLPTSPPSQGGTA